MSDPAGREQYRPACGHRIADALGAVAAARAHGDPDDLAGAKEVLSQITTQPRSKYLGKPSPAPIAYDDPAPVFSNPKLNASANDFKDPLQFWEILSSMINENPPPQDQITALLPIFAPLGIKLGKQWDRTKVPAPILDAMREAAADAGMGIMYGLIPGQFYNGWVFCWLSTGNFRTDYLNRAMITRLGYTANTLEEAVYTSPQIDSEDKLLMAQNKYTMTFVPSPHKTPGFWSVTMYDYKTQYPVENPINRLQSTSPGKDKESNWLSTASVPGRFAILARSYAPGRGRRRIGYRQGSGKSDRQSHHPAVRELHQFRCRAP